MTLNSSWILLLCAAAAAAQSTPNAPILDGQLNDPYWQSIPAHRLEPDQTGLTMDGGEIRAVVRGRYLLLA
ncbi:MAG: hypothetical protein JNK87_18025, partial [Bryobacterales bacterium]|nr:hypothetical protein [Bryobacterales bacterium]